MNCFLLLQRKNPFWIPAEREKENRLHFPKALETFPWGQQELWRWLCPKNSILSPEWVIKTERAGGYFHLLLEQLLKMSEGIMQWLGAVFRLAKQITAQWWLSWWCKRTHGEPCKEGEKGVKSGENEERIGKGITRRACWPSRLPWRALHTHSLHHAQESPDPLCLVYPGCDLPHTSPGLDHCCRVHYWFKLCPWLVLGEDTGFPVASNTPSFLGEVTEATHDYSSILHGELLQWGLYRRHCWLSWLEHQPNPTPPWKATVSPK